MPQLAINNNIITTFRFSALFSLYERKVLFTDLSTYAGSSGSGIFSISSISFELIDQQGIVLTAIDFSDPTKYIVPTVTREFELDLSSLSYPFLFQTYSIRGAIKDTSGNVYYTTVVYKKICQPLNLTDSGYVPGIFQVTANCPDNVLTVKELTVFTYNNLSPVLTTKTGTLYYPTGTIGNVSFTGTPFSNNAVYTGEYRIDCTTESEYDLEDDVTVLVTYITNNVFPVTCANKIADLICCMVELQSEYLKNCNNAIGKAAQQKLNDVTLPFLLGITKEINGQDASIEAALIRKTLNCNCGATSMRQNEMTPINPSVTNIVLTGVGGTTIPSPTIVGSTKQYAISSNVYQIAKGNTGDLAFTITTDTTTSNVVKYLIRFDYSNMASYILTAIAANPTLVAQLNSLISAAAEVDLSGLDGKCVIDLSNTNNFLTQPTTTSTLLVGISTASTFYPINLYCTSAGAIQTALNALGIGTFSVSLSSGILSILSLNNNFNLVSAKFYNPDLTVPFQSTNVTLVTILQGIIDYLCELTALQVTLGNAITLWQLDYNGAMTSQSFNDGVSQASLNQGIANSIYNIVRWISTLTGITCAKIAAAFSDSASSVVSGASRFYGYDGEACVAWTYKQVAMGVIAAIQGDSDVKASFCAINCDDPAICPDVTGINASIVGNNIGVYGLTWAQTPSAVQSVTVRYKRSDATNYTTATSNLLIYPNGNINGTSPFQIAGLTQGVTYDVQIVNNCGGSGATVQVTVPTGAAYSGSYIRGNTLYLLCVGSPVTYYTGAPFGIGQIVYTNSGLTIPLTGYSYLVDNNSGEIFTINSSTGEVLSNTGNTCNTGVSNDVILSNSTSGICGTAPVVRYTNGPFAIGGILYADAALTTPVTGSSYVLNLANGHIYNLNSVTGVIGTDTGLTCSSYSSGYGLENDPDLICSATSTLLYSSVPFATGVTLYTDAGLTTPITGYSFVVKKPTTGEAAHYLSSTTGLVGGTNGTIC